MIGRKKGFSALTNLELQIMQVLWNSGASTAVQVQEALQPTNAFTYTTVQTVLNTLERRGKASRVLSGRAYHYRALITRESILKQAIRELAERMFSGSSEELVVSLIKSRQVNPGRIADLCRKIAAEESSNE